jgi:hypothetical protein
MSGKSRWQLFVGAPTKAGSDRHIARIFMPNKFAHRSSDMVAPGITRIFDRFVDFAVYMLSLIRSLIRSSNRDVVRLQRLEFKSQTSRRPAAIRLWCIEACPRAGCVRMVLRLPDAFYMAYTHLVRCIRWLSRISDAMTGLLFMELQMHHHSKLFFDT